MANPIEIDLGTVQSESGISDAEMEKLCEICVQAVTTAIFENWRKLAQQNLHTTLPNYLNHLSVIDNGRFSKTIILAGNDGRLPVMQEKGASPYDLKQAFQNSQKVRYTIPVYNAKGKQISPGGDWYLSVPFRHGTPGSVQVGAEMPQEIYQIMVNRASNTPLRRDEIPEPYDVPKSRAAIQEGGTLKYRSYEHKHSLYEGLVKKTAAYNTTTQNKYMTFRTAGENSDPDSWIHKGFKALNLAEQAVAATDIDNIVENEVRQFLDEVLGDE